MEKKELNSEELKELNSSSINNSKVAITTFDNPYDPFTQFDKWFMYDELKDYKTCSYLARIAFTSDQLSDDENDLEIERAIDEIIKYDFMNIYRKVYNKNYKNDLK